MLQKPCLLERTITILKEMVQSRPVIGSEGVCQKERGSGQRPERAVGGVAIRAERSSWELN